MLKQLTFLGTCCLITLMALLTSCGIFENEEFELLPVVDCPTLGLNIQDSCVIAGGGGFGLVDANCFCVGDSTFTCPNLQGNIGDACVTLQGTRGQIDTACACVQMVRDSFDCPQMMANFRDTCVGPNGDLGFIQNDCSCSVEPMFDCDSLQRNVGDQCRVSPDVQGVISADCECVVPPDSTAFCPNTGEECTLGMLTIEAIINANCECVVRTDFECMDRFQNVGDTCITATQEFGLVTQDCGCDVNAINFDCGSLNANFGESCRNQNGIEGVVDSTCNCLVPQNVDCPALGADFGEACTNANGETGVVTNECRCLVIQPDDCPDLGLDFGDRCFVNADSLSGVVDRNCDCDTFDCQVLELNIGDACTDANGDRGTVDGDCNCS